MDYLKSIILFVLAGLCEIGGGYLIWLWIREGKGWEFAIIGAFILVLYGIIPTSNLLILEEYTLLMVEYLS